MILRKEIMTLSTDDENKALSERIFTQNMLKLSIAAKKEKTFNIICIFIAIILFISQYYYFIGYSPIKLEDAFTIIGVPDFNPLYGMLLYVLSTFIFGLLYPFKKVSMVSRFRAASRKLSPSNSPEELFVFQDEVLNVLHKRKRTQIRQCFIISLLGCITAYILFLSYNLHNYVELHNDLGSNISKIDNIGDQAIYIDNLVNTKQIPTKLKGYYYNQIIYQAISKQNDLTNSYASDASSTNSSRLDIAILQGKTLNKDLYKYKDLYLDNLSTWALQDSNGKFMKSNKSDLNGVFLHNKDQLLILGNYLKQN